MRRATGDLGVEQRGDRSMRLEPRFHHVRLPIKRDLANPDAAARVSLVY